MEDGSVGVDADSRKATVDQRVDEKERHAVNRRGV
jgi:hypothetical protein